MLKPWPLLWMFLCSGCGNGEGEDDGQTATTAGGGSSAQDEAVVSNDYCINTFQADLLENTGKAQLKACIVADEATRVYLEKKHRLVEPKIRIAFTRVVEKYEIGELEMPGAEQKLSQQMLTQLQAMLPEQTVQEVRLVNFELW